MKSVRRRDKRIWRVVFGVFVMVFLFSFMIQKYDSDGEVVAASLDGFDPGFIISDYQMGNYNSMSEEEIQAFLTAKNSCPNTNYDYYLRLSSSASVIWHFENGHFVCLSEERFGDGEVIGSGDTAAHIIWQAAQDYRINPQVLLVLLQKESSLITDPIPNNMDYRKATGYGCPDTAACSSKYFGFKNQIRNAAALFRAVLDGGWTNYPLGDNYVQYNPDAGCGGSVVNIRSLATSALYRYTPYQPNAETIAAGYGTAYCGAYGNRNFYLYFEDWFGGITEDAVKYISLETPRYMEVANDTMRINPRTMERIDLIEKGRLLKFSTKVVFRDGTSCLRTDYGTRYDEDKCLMIDSLKEVELNYNLVPEGYRKKVISANSKKYFIRGEGEVASFQDKMLREVVATVEFRGKLYYITSYDYYNNNSEFGFLSDDLSDAPEYSMMSEAKQMTPVDDSVRLNPITGEYYDRLKKNMIYSFSSYIIVDGVKYYRTMHNTLNDINAAVSEEDLRDVSFVELEEPLRYRLVGDTERINPVTDEVYDVLENGRELVFTTKVYVDQKWYYRTADNSNRNYCLGIESSALGLLNDS